MDGRLPVDITVSVKDPQAKPPSGNPHIVIDVEAENGATQRLLVYKHSIKYVVLGTVQDDQPPEQAG